MTSTPRAERPHMPAGYLSPKLLPWTWAESRLTESRSYWVATVTAEGEPHSRPVWAIWHDGNLYFSNGSRTRRNLERGSAISINLESADECVILEGTASPLLDLPRAEHVAALYNAKYSWNLEAKAGELLEVKPRVVFGWIVDGSGRDGGALFSQTATR